MKNYTPHCLFVAECCHSHSTYFEFPRMKLLWIFEFMLLFLVEQINSMLHSLLASSFWANTWRSLLIIAHLPRVAQHNHLLTLIIISSIMLGVCKGSRRELPNTKTPNYVQSAIYGGSNSCTYLCTISSISYGQWGRGGGGCRTRGESTTPTTISGEAAATPWAPHWLHEHFLVSHSTIMGERSPNWMTNDNGRSFAVEFTVAGNYNWPLLYVYDTIIIPSSHWIPSAALHLLLLNAFSTYL